MNKLTLAATLTLCMGGYVMASDCTVAPPTPKQEALVYDFNVNLKTTAAKAGKVPKVSVCDVAPDRGFYRVKSSKNLKGFIYTCSSWCVDYPPTAEIPASSNLVWEVDAQDPSISNQVWEVIQGTPGTPGGLGIAEDWAAVLWENKSKTAYAEDDPLEWDAFWRIGKNKTDLETSWILDNDMVELNGKGFGKVNKNNIPTNMSGNVVGWLGPPTFLANKPKNEDECEPDVAMPFDFCVPSIELEEDTIAFGTWKMKHNAKASKAYNDRGVLPYPKWWN